MKKIIISLILLLGLLTNHCFSQFSSQVNPWRVVVISPNYNNVYPRFSTFQNAYLSVRDSADDGKYFILNTVTSFENISDYTSAWRDSILNKNPYLVLTNFGQAYNDSVVGITTEEFLLVAGILGINSLTAGDGLNFTSHKFNVNALRPILISNDSLFFAYSAPLYLTPNTLGLKRYSWSGLQVNSDSGLRVLGRPPLKLKGDTVYIQKSNIFGGDADSLYIDWNSNHFDIQYSTSPAVNLRLDSGLTSSATGLKVWLGSPRLSFLSNTKLTIPDAVAGNGLSWISNALVVNTKSPIFVKDDSVFFYYKNPITVSNDSLYLTIDSGLTIGTSGLSVKTDGVRIGLNASKQISILETVAGLGLAWVSNALNIIPNEFAKTENDTLKIKTSYVTAFYGDSLTSNVTSAGVGVLPYDTTGVPVLYTGKIKRVTYTYQLASSGNDTIISISNNISVTIGDKIRCTWVNGSSEARIQLWSQSSHTWSNSIQIPMTGFANKKWRVLVESYAEAE